MPPRNRDRRCTKNWAVSPASRPWWKPCSRIADDPRIVEHFARVNIVMLNERLVQKFCHVADGPCPDTAKSMAQAHQHMAIREDDFNALVEDLNWAMDQRNIPRRTQNRLLARLAAMHGEIVNH